MSSKAEELGGISTRYTIDGSLGKPGTLFGSPDLWNNQSSGK